MKAIKISFPYLLGIIACFFVLASCNEKKKGHALYIKPQATIDSSTAIASRKTSITEESPKTNIVDSFFTKIYNNNNFNGTVLVTDKGKMIYNKSFGFNNFSSKGPLSEYSIFQLASVSKQFTAVSIMLLQERGRLNYNDPVTKFFPGFPYPEITIDLLLSHRSGLPNYVYFCDEFYSEKDKPISNKKLIELFIQHKPQLYFTPDKKFNYCNTNYCILAAIVEQASQTDFAQFVQKEIFEPAGMKNTYIGHDHTGAHKSMTVTGYDDKDLPPSEDYMDGLLGDKGVYSCSHDLNIWDQVLYSEKIVKQKTLITAMKPANDDMIGGRNYCYGWRIKSLPDGTPVYYHGGWWKGFNTFFMRNPKDNSSIIILSNRVNGSFNDIISFIPVFYNQKPLKESPTI
jgi:CubicO group peptidase (beta-lactamase class C family)